MHANLRGSALLAALALGAGDDRKSSGRWCRWRPSTTPIRRGVERYDRLFAEFPALYRAQKGMFKRLNRRR